ncbi:plasmid mobilization relaxosome protein MobC [Nocardia sp. GCM10030253]|uniref:plasmid mobilization relaxosome protein MobC n=1 Tax=Nocardia sp. GCM10030253 TaxID=3273404 RepID=UPI00363915BE
MKLSNDEHDALTARAEAADITVPRLLVEATLEGSTVEAGRAHAVLSILELDSQVRGAMNNLNQLTRYAHQNRELAEETAAAVVAATRACLSLDAAARWVMGKSPAVSEVSITDEDLAVALDEDGAGDWAARVDPDA